MVSEKDARRFWAKVDKRGEEECWPWLGGRTGSGYGTFYLGGVMTGAHRFALELELGRPLLPKMDAAHEPVICHNKLCCNPAHLREATRRENALDREKDGTVNSGERHGSYTHPERVPRGEENGSARLANAEVVALLAIKGTMTLAAAGAIFGISRMQVSRIWRGINRA